MNTLSELDVTADLHPDCDAGSATAAVQATPATAAASVASVWQPAHPNVGASISNVTVNPHDQILNNLNSSQAAPECNRNDTTTAKAQSVNACHDNQLNCNGTAAGSVLVIQNQNPNCSKVAQINKRSPTAVLNPNFITSARSPTGFMHGRSPSAATLSSFSLRSGAIPINHINNGSSGVSKSQTANLLSQNDHHGLGGNVNQGTAVINNTTVNSCSTTKSTTATAGTSASINGSSQNGGSTNNTNSASDSLLVNENRELWSRVERQNAEIQYLAKMVEELNLMKSGKSGLTPSIQSTSQNGTVIQNVSQQVQSNNQKDIKTSSGLTPSIQGGVNGLTLSLKQSQINQNQSGGSQVLEQSQNQSQVMYNNANIHTHVQSESTLPTQYASTTNLNQIHSVHTTPRLHSVNRLRIGNKANVITMIGGYQSVCHPTPHFTSRSLSEDPGVRSVMYRPTGSGGHIYSSSIIGSKTSSSTLQSGQATVLPNNVTSEIVGTVTTVGEGGSKDSSDSTNQNLANKAPSVVTGTVSNATTAAALSKFNFRFQPGPPISVTQTPFMRGRDLKSSAAVPNFKILSANLSPRTNFLHRHQQRQYQPLTAGGTPITTSRSMLTNQTNNFKNSTTNFNNPTSNQTAITQTNSNCNATATTGPTVTTSQQTSSKKNLLNPINSSSNVTPVTSSRSATVGPNPGQNNVNPRQFSELPRTALNTPNIPLGSAAQQSSQQSQSIKPGSQTPHQTSSSNLQQMSSDRILRNAASLTPAFALRNLPGTMSVALPKNVVWKNNITNPSGPSGINSVIHTQSSLRSISPINNYLNQNSQPGPQVSAGPSMQSNQSTNHQSSQNSMGNQNIQNQISQGIQTNNSQNSNQGSEQPQQQVQRNIIGSAIISMTKIPTTTATGLTAIGSHMNSSSSLIDSTLSNLERNLVQCNVKAASPILSTEKLAGNSMNMKQQQYQLPPQPPHSPIISAEKVPTSPIVFAEHSPFAGAQKVANNVVQQQQQTTVNQTAVPKLFPQLSVNNMATVSNIGGPNLANLANMNQSCLPPGFRTISTVNTARSVQHNNNGLPIPGPVPNLNIHNLNHMNQNQIQNNNNNNNQTLQNFNQNHHLQNHHNHNHLHATPGQLSSAYSSVVTTELEGAISAGASLSPRNVVPMPFVGGGGESDADGEFNRERDYNNINQFFGKSKMQQQQNLNQQKFQSKNQNQNSQNLQSVHHHPLTSSQLSMSMKSNQSGGGPNGKRRVMPTYRPLSRKESGKENQGPKQNISSNAAAFGYNDFGTSVPAAKPPTKSVNSTSTSQQYNQQKNQQQQQQNQKFQNQNLVTDESDNKTKGNDNDEILSHSLNIDDYSIVMSDLNDNPRPTSGTVVSMMTIDLNGGNNKFDNGAQQQPLSCQQNMNSGLGLGPGESGTTAVNGMQNGTSNTTTTTKPSQINNIINKFEKMSSQSSTATAMPTSGGGRISGTSQGLGSSMVTMSGGKRVMTGSPPSIPRTSQITNMGSVNNSNFKSSNKSSSGKKNTSANKNQNFSNNNQNQNPKVNNKNNSFQTTAAPIQIENIDDTINSINNLNQFNELGLPDPPTSPDDDKLNNNNLLNQSNHYLRPELQISSKLRQPPAGLGQGRNCSTNEMIQVLSNGVNVNAVNKSILSQNDQEDLDGEIDIDKEIENYHQENYQRGNNLDQEEDDVPSPRPSDHPSEDHDQFDMNFDPHLNNSDSNSDPTSLYSFDPRYLGNNLILQHNNNSSSNPYPTTTTVSSATTIKRIRGCRHSLAIVPTPLVPTPMTILDRNQQYYRFSVQIKDTQSGWVGGMGLGFVDFLPKSTSTNAMALPEKGWELTNDKSSDSGTTGTTSLLIGYWGRLFLSGEEIITNWSSENLQKNDIVSCCYLKEEKEVLVMVNNEVVLWSEEMCDGGFGEGDLYPVVDCFARTTSVSLVNHNLPGRHLWKIPVGGKIRI